MPGYEAWTSPLLSGGTQLTTWNNGTVTVGGGGDGGNIKLQGGGSSAEIYEKDIYACKVRGAEPMVCNLCNLCCSGQPIRRLCVVNLHPRWTLAPHDVVLQAEGALCIKQVWQHCIELLCHGKGSCCCA